ncbi:zinc finger protein 705A-like [Dipodomys merriami]|uniref:zinc finger protein 705A-like n=1 Tax=Dipodomys merriami TaxID=94247 RepID=UPI003855B3F5
MDSYDHATVTPKEAFTFQDVAVDFTAEEWAILDASQRKLHRDVMWESISHLLAVGVDLCESDMLSQLELGEMWRERREFLRALKPVQITHMSYCTKLVGGDKVFFSKLALNF